ncbi:Slc25a44 [Symbiodinium natans]|uniref:Slc25a44 protein n=1 Tax=Symbiodinium natans TaxID=878477 RepID=A0A812N428_9DINO|nr:Slc25a44 [Symbiodinium natans]
MSAAAPFLVKRSGRQAEVQQNWESLDLARVCGVTCAVDIALAVVSYPLWHLKTREQVLGGSAASHLRDLHRHHGWPGLYRGALFGTVGLLPGFCCWVVAYEWTKWHAARLLPSSAAPGVAAAVGECCWIALAMPVENVAVRMQCREASAPLLRPGASWHEVQTLWREGGPTRCWNGGLLGLASSLPHSATWWLVYENSKSFLLASKAFDQVRPEVKQGVAAAGCAAAAIAASCATTLLLNPLDVVKSQVQAASCKEKISLRQYFGGQSLARLFLRGLGPRLILAAAHGLSDCFTYEATMHFGKSMP